MRKAIAIVTAVATLAVSFSAFAQGGRDETTTQCRGRATTASSPRDQEICFTDTNVSGTNPGATGATVRPGPRFHGPSLIRHRAHFVAQMLGSVENF